MKSLLFVLLTTLLLAAPVSAEPSPRAVAEAYGIKKFSQVEEIGYTFHAAVGGKAIARSWVWRPKDDTVLFKDVLTGREARYNRSSFDAGSSLGEVDRWFINDQYWLLFPFHLVWDKGAQFSRKRAVPPLPGFTEELDVLIVQYPAQGGYTPGDIYELYLTPESLIAAWVYRAGGGEPTRISTWEEHRHVGPLLFSFEHKGAEPGFRVWFDEVTVETE